MKTFLRKALLYLAVTFAFFVIADGAISRHLINSSYRAVKVLKEALDGRINADIIVMGNSRAWVQYDPMALDTVLNLNSYNLGVDGCQINRQIQEYTLYRMHNTTPPRLIIQNIDLLSMYYSNKYQIDHYYPFLRKPSTRREIVSTVPLSFEERFLPLIRYRRSLNQIFSFSGMTLYKGYRGIDKKWSGSGLPERDSVEFYADDRVAQVFDSYLSRCNLEGVKVIFVYAPIYSGITERISNIDEMYDTYRHYADKFDIPVLDYSDMWLCSDTSFFYNEYHMNIRGAEIFSDSLSHDIKRLLSESESYEVLR